MITHHFGGGVYAKETRIAAGESLAQHVHKHDHLSILASGHVLVTVDDESTHYEGPCCLTIVAGKSHRVTALTEALWYCVHKVPDDLRDPALIDETLIEGG